MLENESKSVGPRLGSPQQIPNRIIPGRGPVAMPVSMPGPPGQGGYNRYREMTLEEMLLENRVVFLVGEREAGRALRQFVRIHGPWDGDDLAKHPENDHPEPPMFVFNPNKFFQIPGIDIPVVDCIPNVVESVLFRLHSETLVDVAIRTIRKAFPQCVIGFCNKAGINEVAITFADARRVQLSVVVCQKWKGVLFT